MRSPRESVGFPEILIFQKCVLAESQWLRSYEQIIFWKSVFWLYLDLGTSDWGDLYCIRFLSSRRFFWGTMSKREKLTQDVDQRCYASTLPQRFVDALGSIFSIFWSIHHSTRLDERNRMQYRSPQSDDPNSNEDQIIAQRYCSTLPQRFVNGSSMAVGLVLNRFQWSIAHFTQLDELFRMSYNNKIFDPYLSKNFLTPKNLSNCLAATTKKFFGF